MAGPDPAPAPDPDRRPNPDDPARRVRSFLRHCQRRMEAVAAGGKAVEGAAALADAIDGAAPRDPAPTPVRLPVLDSLDRLTGADPLERAFLDLAPILPWIPTPRASDGGTELALAPLDRVLDLGDTVVGIMCVGPGATYPLHHHPPQELYLTIAGEGRWRYGGAVGDETVGPGRTLYNHPGDQHRATAGPLPVVALYVLW